MDVVKEKLNVDMNYAARRENLPKDECNNCTIAERILEHWNNPPYKATPKIMLIYLVMVTAKKLNWLPAKGGVSK